MDFHDKLKNDLKKDEHSFNAIEACTNVNKYWCSFSYIFEYHLFLAVSIVLKQSP